MRLYYYTVFNSVHIRDFVRSVNCSTVDGSVLESRRVWDGTVHSSVRNRYKIRISTRVIRTTPCRRTILTA